MEGDDVPAGAGSSSRRRSIVTCCACAEDGKEGAMLPSRTEGRSRDLGNESRGR